MDWWKRVMPIEGQGGASQQIRYRGKNATIATAESGPDPDREDRVMLVRPRRSRIYYLGQFFDYPISLSPDTLRKLGMIRLVKIGTSYVWATLFPYRKPRNLEEFYVNQFGRELYKTFFESYTEKVWGVPCSAISAEWGAQRVKGLSLSRAALHFLRKQFSAISLGDKKVETSLIEQFLYPKYGPGHMWETVAHDIKADGGKILVEHELVGLKTQANRITGGVVSDKHTGKKITIAADYVFSTMPIKDLVNALDREVPEAAYGVGNNLLYRDFITVGLLLDKLAVCDEKDGGMITDNWIYIQEPGTKVGRVQIFNNWSPYMVVDKSKVWIGLEYFCTEGDDMWNMGENEFTAFAIDEVTRIGLIHKEDVRDSVVIKMKKTYPGYFGAYEHFDQVRAYLDTFENLFLIGRNGMHKYNNQDHSMLTAMVAVDNIISGRTDKSNIWAVNAEQDYHETKEG